MSGTWPTTPAPDAITVRSVCPTLVSTAHSLKRQVRSRGAQRWGFTLEYNNLVRAEFAPLFSNLLAQRGQYGTFTFYPPSIGSRAAGSGSPVVRTATASGRSIPVGGLSAGQAIARAGDFLKFSGHSKVYLLTADATANGAGEATFAIEPALYAAVAQSETITLDAVPFTVALASDTGELPLSAPLIAGLKIELLEVLP